ncbi:MAG: VWA domain-containing protein [Firmicutes bacterium]|nr:VWA domain-containing protein [Alicyclobacillaceae bacterium]MCL6496531.1 VWA domain-containing protein [Bacillota bacterium]
MQSGRRNDEKPRGEGATASVGRGRAWRTAAPEWPPWVHRVVSPFPRVRKSRLYRWRQPQPDPAVDWRKTFRQWARTGGLGLDLRRRPKRRWPERLVVFWDVSGSMVEYAEWLWPWLYRVLGDAGEWAVFAFGTGVADVSAAFSGSYRHGGERLQAVFRVWGSGTTIGESLLGWLQGPYGGFLRPGTMVWIISDGWDRGDPEALRAALTRFRRAGTTVYWLHPLMHTPGFSPATRALKAALPFLRALVPADGPAELLNVGEYLR